MQLSLPIQLPVARPLWPMEACMCLLDQNEDQVLALIEDGSLSLAFDIAAPGATRREIRIWRESLLAVLQESKQPKADKARAIIDEMMPGRDLLHREVQRILSCSVSHVTELIRLEALVGIGPRPEHSCTGHMTRISRVSLAAFLERRIVR